MNRIVITVLALIVVVLLPSCAVENEDAVKVTGTVVLIPIDAFGIKGDDGRNYMPTNLSSEFQKDGLRVRFEAKELPGLASVHDEWGNIVEIVTIHKL